MAKVAEGIKVSASRLSRDAAEGVRSANAILTSDTRPKSVTARFVWEGKTVTLAGIAKGNFEIVKLNSHLLKCVVSYLVNYFIIFNLTLDHLSFTPTHSSLIWA